MRQLLFYYVLSQFINFCHKTVAFRNNEILPFVKNKVRCIALYTHLLLFP